MRGTLQRGPLALFRAQRLPPAAARRRGFRYIQVQAAPSEEPATANSLNLPVAATSPIAQSSDARFDVIGSPYSMLSVSLSASQNLYTRRGTLVGLSGKSDNVISTLSILEPFRRAIVGIPFLYQKISSTTPVTALVSVRSPVTSFTVLHLDGTVDWMVAQRRAILAWTGHSLGISPTINTKLSIVHWGSSKVTGRGLLALVGEGQVYSVELKAGEQWIAHPSNIVAYTITTHPPQPYRFKSTSLRFQIPDLRLSQFLTRYRFFRDMSGSDTWKTTVQLFHNLRTWARRTIWGDRLFLQFEGPATILVQSRASRVRDVLSNHQVNEIADAPAGVAQDAVNRLEYRRAAEEAVAQAPVPSRTVEQLTQEIKGVEQTIATIQEGKVEFEKSTHTPQATTTSTTKASM